MKQIILLILFINQLLATPPDWYRNQSILSNNYEIIGYGEGTTLEEAKQISKSDISKMIQTILSSNLSIEKNIKDDIYTKKISSNINEKSNVILTNIEVIQTSFQDNKYYVAIRYINLPIAKKIKLLIKNNNILEEDTNKYLNKTSLMNELKKEFSFYPKVTLYKNNIIINNQSFHLVQNDFIKLFVNIENQDIPLDRKDTYKNKDYYFIKVKTKRSGYLNIFQVYQSGETVLLLSNKKIKSNKNLIYPNPKLYDGLESVVPKGQNKTKDLTIVALCINKKDFSLFDKIDTNIKNSGLLFGELLDIIDSCQISTKIITTNK